MNPRRLLVDGWQAGFDGLFDTYWFGVFGLSPSGKFGQLLLTTTPTVPLKLSNRRREKAAGGRGSTANSLDIGILDLIEQSH